ncbi:hypothetical protein M0Q97_01605 [Candidatus Dojkabacteria bacterium]|jgi:hypothetical protein|nr:hypothetical protein [Candidatus Dojkabacteria bacterium]
MEDKNYKLVKNIIKPCIQENMWCEIDIFKNILQEQLNQNLKFKTIVSDIEINIVEHIQTFDVTYEDETGLIKVMHITIN